jgi:SAM-dependent methyltransferase
MKLSTSTRFPAHEGNITAAAIGPVRIPDSLIGQRLIGRFGDPHDRLQRVVSSLLSSQSSDVISALEAGCGSISRLNLPANTKLTGIDISLRQLERNVGLDHKVLGNLEEHDWGATKFDIVVCWDVIEHLPNPVKALNKLLGCLAPGGILVLAYPNLWSLKGLVTKFTPYWFHAAFYRYVIGDTRSSDQWDQFPTYFSAQIAPNKIERLAQSLGHQVIYEEIYEGPVQCGLRQRRKLYDFAFQTLSSVSRLLTFGKMDLGLSDCITVIQNHPKQNK